MLRFQGCQSVVVESLDRLSRSTSELARFLGACSAAGISVSSADGAVVVEATTASE
jgi:DNA invertase Pin-like site-specific DNA recombinase